CFTAKNLSLFLK
ncbi:bacterial regulatory s, luxR family protein, partial [Vibrio parahaemolyticus V-223/04]